MAGSAGSIYVDLLLNSGKFTDGTKRAQKAIGDFGDATAKAGKIAGTALAAATAAVTALTIRQAGIIDSTVKVSRSLGVVNESFQALATVSDEAGVEQEQLGNLITKSQKSIVDAAKGTGEAAKAFKALGLNAKELINLAPDEQFAKIEEALAGIENPTLRTATALQIFGKSGRDAVKISEDFAARLDEARAFNDKFNISVSNIDARKVEEANDSFGRLGKAVGGLGNTIAIEVAPLVTAFSQALLGAGVDGKTMGEAVKSGFEIAGNVIDVVREGALGIRAIFIKVAEAVFTVGVRFQEASVAFAEFAVRVNDSASNLQNLALAQKNLADAQALANGAADAYSDLNDEAANFVTTNEKIAKIQEDAQKRAEEQEKKFGIKPGQGGDGSIAALDEKRLETLQSISSELEKQTAAVQIQNDYFGESKSLLDRQLEQQQIMQKLREAGIELSDEELSNLNAKLDALQSEKQLNIELQEAEKERQKQADLLIKQQEEQQKLLDESVQNVREELVGGLIDAAKGAGSFADKMKSVAANIAEAVIKAQLLKVITDATGGGGSSSGGGGFLGPLLSFLPSFDVGTDYVPYDMVAKIHKGERILTPDENAAYMAGGAVTMNVYTPDADSFRASDRQITRRIKSRLAR